MLESLLRQENHQPAMKGHLKQLAGFFSLLSVLLMIIIMPQGCLSLIASFEHSIYIPPSPLNVPERRVMCSVAGKYTEAHGGDGPSPGWPSKLGRVGFTPEPWRVPTSDIQEGALVLPLLRHRSWGKLVNAPASMLLIYTNKGYKDTQLRTK
ncbi:unnamed protein product [Rangifer tarandus platyrhynchus]|uniref:Uncharacterized protein n=2 Tax=Rangifer tarandus platyrhynchus TaxID=3082113 RepID=A0AC59Y491_RANTA|nr:unnamed protein product [Rangifer tarandus platyrhynchus]